MDIQSSIKPRFAGRPVQSQIVADPASGKAVWIPQDALAADPEARALWADVAGQFTGALAAESRGWGQAGLSMVAVGVSNGELFHRIAADMAREGDDARLFGAVCDVGEAMSTALGYPATASTFNLLSHGFAVIADTQDANLFWTGEPPKAALRLFERTRADIQAWQGPRP